MRVGFISRWPVGDRSALSGMPASAWSSLLGTGLELVHLDSAPHRSRPLSEAALRAARALVPARARPLARNAARTAVALATPGGEYRRITRQAAAAAKRVKLQLSRHSLDAIIGVCISTELFALETSLPVVYASDATAHLINTTYPRYMALSSSYKEACHHVELTSLRRAHAVLPASERTRDSIIQDYGVAPSRVNLTPMGANVVPSAPVAVGSVPSPSVETVELALVAADPIRKRTDFCVAVAEEVQRRGISTRLHLIGPPTRRAASSDVVVCHGRLALGDPADRSRHVAVLRRAHLMLLPSIGEMFGIAPAEAAHFGKPSIVSNAGGLPTVVVDGDSGIVMATHATSTDYADEIERLCTSPDAYQRLSAGALRRAQHLLNWEAWARTASATLRSAANGHA